MENELLIPTILVVALTGLCIYGMISKKVILMRWGLFIWALIAIAANLGEFFVNACIYNGSSFIYVPSHS